MTDHTAELKRLSDGLEGHIADKNHNRIALTIRHLIGIVLEQQKQIDELRELALPVEG